MGCKKRFFNWGYFSDFGSAAESAARVATIDARQAIEDLKKAVKSFAFNDLTDIKDSGISVEGNTLSFKKDVQGKTYKVELSPDFVAVYSDDENGHFYRAEIRDKSIVVNNHNDKSVEINAYGIKIDGEPVDVLAMLEEIESLKERVTALENK